MFKYDKLWQLLKERGITKYRLKKNYNISPTVLLRLKRNQGVNLSTLDRLCNILNCNIEDIVEHIQDDNKF